MPEATDRPHDEVRGQKAIEDRGGSLGFASGAIESDREHRLLSPPRSIDTSGRRPRRRGRLFPQYLHSSYCRAQGSRGETLTSGRCAYGAEQFLRGHRSSQGAGGPTEGRSLTYNRPLVSHASFQSEGAADEVLVTALPECRRRIRKASGSRSLVVVVGL